MVFEPNITDLINVVFESDTDYDNRFWAERGVMIKKQPKDTNIIGQEIEKHCSLAALKTISLDNLTKAALFRLIHKKKIFAHRRENCVFLAV